MKYSVSLSAAILFLLVFGVFSAVAADTVESNDGVTMLLKDFGGNTLNVSACSVIHRDGSASKLKVEENGTLNVKTNESGILICRHGESFQGAKLSSYQGGIVTAVPMDLIPTRLDIYRDSLRGTLHPTVDMGSIGTGGIWD